MSLFGSARDLRYRLGDWRRYERQIDQLHSRYLYTSYLYSFEQDGVCLASVILDKARFAKLLARTVARGEYRFAPGRVRTIQVDGKERVVYSFRLTDLILHRVVAEIVEEAAAPHLSSCLYSYRPGVSWWQPIAGFAAYARRHRQERPDPRSRGLYVLRRDIQSYTDSIPVEPDSPLWPMLRRLLAADRRDGEISPSDWQVIEEVVRPTVFVEPGRYFQMCRGVPTGQPISCVLFNYYLAAFDRELDSIPGAFYARYSDDLLFAHPDAEVVKEVATQIDVALAALRLQAHPDKGEELYLTAAGRHSADWPAAKGSPHATFLGCRVSAQGAISLRQKKVRAFLAVVKQRARQTMAAMEGASPERIGRAVCSVVNQVIAPRNNVFEQRSATLLRRAVTDRQQLKQLDYLVALAVAATLSHRRGARAFRAVPYRKLRQEWALESLYHARNRWARR